MLANNLENLHWWSKAEDYYKANEADINKDVKAVGNFYSKHHDVINKDVKGAFKAGLAYQKSHNEELQDLHWWSKAEDFYKKHSKTINKDLVKAGKWGIKEYKKDHSEELEEMNALWTLEHPLAAYNLEAELLGGDQSQYNSYIAAHPDAAQLEDLHWWSKAEDFYKKHSKTINKDLVKAGKWGIKEYKKDHSEELEEMTALWNLEHPLEAYNLFTMQVGGDQSGSKAFIAAHPDAAQLEDLHWWSKVEDFYKKHSKTINKDLIKAGKFGIKEYKKSHSEELEEMVLSLQAYCTIYGKVNEECVKEKGDGIYMF